MFLSTLNVLNKIWLFLSILVIFSSKLFGFQDTNLRDSIQNEILVDSNALKPKYGIFFNYGLNLFDANFSKLPKVPNCCPSFTAGSGGGFSAGLSFELPALNFIDDIRFINYSAYLRLSYDNYSGSFKKDEFTTVFVDSQVVEGVFQHSLRADLFSLGLEFGAINNFFDKFSARLGFRLGFPVLTHFSQKETIIKPADKGTFSNGRRTRNEYSGDIPDALNVQLSLNIGVFYELPMNKKKSLFLTPQLDYTFYFTPIVSGISWNAHSFRAGLSIRYQEPPPPPPPPPPPIPAPYPPFPVPPSPPVITAGLEVIQLDTNNVECKVSALKVEDFISYNMRPLLTYVFFDYNSSEIPSRYVKLTPEEAQKFSLKSLENLETLPTYYHILNIVGKRLQEYPDVTIKLVGTNSNQGLEKDNKELSMRRANAVRDYLIGVWGIDPARIKIEARNLPQEYSNPEEPAGQEENQRVEIVSNNWILTEPVFTVDTIRQVKASKIKIYPRAKAETGIRNWSIDVLQDNKKIKSFEGTNTLPSVLEWEVSSSNGFVDLQNSSKINFVLNVYDSLGTAVKSPTKSIPIERMSIEKKRRDKVTDREYEYYSLILFDYGKSTLGFEHKKVIDFIKGRITPQSTIIISGHTDAIGNEDVNLKLSEARAKAVANRLDLKNARVYGAGESEMLYDNSLPEGRFYCRTVKITIETPVENNK